jgi:ribonuclease R
LNKDSKKTSPKKKTAPKSAMPTKAQIVEFANSPNGSKEKREIARAFGVKGAARVDLRRLLNEMTQEGLLPERRRAAKSRARKTLPNVTVLTIVGQDNDGELMAHPVKWEGDAAPPLIVIASASEDRQTLGVGDRVLARLKQETDSASPFAYEARPIKRLGQSAHTVLGVFQLVGKQGRVTPVDRKSARELEVSAANANGARAGELVRVEIIPGGPHGLKRARVKEVLGPVDAPSSVSTIAIHAHGLRTDFSTDVIAEAQAIDAAALSQEAPDYRDIPFVTIDPKDARDFDDAVWATPDDDPDNQDGWIIAVAIADVSRYVQPNSALDRESLKRGNSTYFPDQVLPMLPERLSNDLCSLRPREDRPAMIVRMTFDSEGNKKAHKFSRGIIRSQERLTYQQAQGIADGKEKASRQTTQLVKNLWAAYACLKQELERRGPLDLDLPEHEIVLGPDGRVADIKLKDRIDAHRLIEEFMIMANVAAAETLEQHKTPLLYRVHDAPSREKAVALAEYLATLNMKLALGQTLKPLHFNKVLKLAAERDQSEMVSVVVLRSQSQAVYSNSNLGHFGLNLRRYAHFTSPIRRYADLIVHRALVRALDLGPGGMTDAEAAGLEEIGADISNLERQAMAAERDCNDRYMAGYMADRIGQTFEGRVAGVTRFGLFVRLKDTGADGLIPVRTLPGGYFRHDEKGHRLIDDATGLSFDLGETVTIRIAEAAPITGGLRFDLIEGGRYDKKPLKKAGKKSAKKGVKKGDKSAAKRKPVRKGPRKAVKAKKRR